MRGPKEIRKWINYLRKRYGKPNGVVNKALFDNPWMEVKWAKSFKQRKRNKTIEYL